jgi:hypothetical protein
MAGHDLAADVAFNRPHVIRDPNFHRGRYAAGLRHSAEVVGDPAAMAKKVARSRAEPFVLKSIIELRDGDWTNLNASTQRICGRPRQNSNSSGITR